MSKAPFPQANNMELLFNVLNDIGQFGLSNRDVAEKYGIKERQGSYYLDALLFLALVEKINTKYFLTPSGVKVRLSSASDMKAVFIDEILKNKIINELFQQTRQSTKEDMNNIICDRLLSEYNMADSTAKRRANTVIKWFEYFNEILGG